MDRVEIREEEMKFPANPESIRTDKETHDLDKQKVT